jgi:hypothetical protein
MAIDGRGKANSFIENNNFELQEVVFTACTNGSCEPSAADQTVGGKVGLRVIIGR